MGNERKYWEREAEILPDLQEHDEPIDQIYVVRRSIYAGFKHTFVRKGLDDNAISELGFPAVGGYRLDDLLRVLTRDIKFGGLLLPAMKCKSLSIVNDESSPSKPWGDEEGELETS